MKASRDDIIFDSIKYFFLIFLVVVTLFPFINILAVSINDPLDTMLGGIGLWPRAFSMINYQDIFENPNIWIATFNSVTRIMIAGVIHTFLTAMVAYVLSRKKFVFRIPFAIIYILTMYIDGGIIPTYYLFRALGLTNTLFVYWIPGLTSAWNLLIIRTYIRSLPESFIESAKIEGAGDFYIFLKIIIPLCVPVLATIALFSAVWHWNYWIDTFLYNSSNIQLTTLQYELMKKIQSANSAMSGTTVSSAYSMAASLKQATVTPKSLRAAMTIIVTVPIVMVYPFLQRFFVKGLTIGGVKE
jgi:putative aldouronate transport system permease protein